MNRLSEDDEAYNRYHQWRQTYHLEQPSGKVDLPNDHLTRTLSLSPPYPPHLPFLCGKPTERPPNTYSLSAVSSPISPIYALPHLAVIP